ncbi:hypothetical protein AB0C51_10210 [Streptomyces pathocidini]|uniref:hypothetical protein n=1 Tax=Streptomyces pathocidini TaxID=1650571 RepID=UPI0034020CAC
MDYLEKAREIRVTPREIRVTAQAGGAALTVPPDEVCEHTARRLSGELAAGDGQSGDDLRDADADEPARSAMPRLVDRVAPDRKD